MQKSVYHVHLTAPSHPNGGWEQGFLQNAYKYKHISWQEYANTWGQVPCKNIIAGEVDLMKPDFVFMQLQGKSFFDNEFIRDLQKVCPVVVFNEDVRDSVQWLIDLAPDVSLLSNLDDAVTLMENRLAAGWMLPTYDERLYFQIPQYQKSYQRYGEIVFIGNQYAKSANLHFPNSQQRVEMVEYMQAQFGSRFQAYGLGNLNSYLPPHKEAEAYRNARIVIGHNNFHRTDYQSDRMVRAIASGALFVPHFNNVSRSENLWMANGSWSNFHQLGTIVDEYLTDSRVEIAIRKIQQSEIGNHSPAMKVIELQRKIKELL